MNINHRQRYVSVFLITILLLVSVSVFAGAVKETPVSSDTIQFVDSRGKTILLEKIPQRIVSLSPNITETLFALGAQERIFGRTDYCDYPQETKTIPSMGDLFTPSIEMIVSTGCDLVIVSTLGQSQTIEAIEQTGINVAFIEESSDIEGTYRLIEQVGILIGSHEESLRLIDSMKHMISYVQQTIPQQKRPTVYYVAGFGEWGEFTASGDTYIHDIIELAGGQNIAADSVNWSFQTELLIERDPNIIILPPSWGSTFEETYKQFSSAHPYNTLSAVRQHTVYPFDNGMVERQGPRSADAVLALAKLFHPSLNWEDIE